MGEGVTGTQAPFLKGNVKDANIISDNLISSLAPHKMYRKELLNTNNIRFLDNKHVPVGEDQVFNMKAYASARKISILADKDYYYFVKRDDSGNLGKSSRYSFDKPEKFLNLGKECFNAIIDSSKFSNQEKEELLAIYIGRLFNSRGRFFKTLERMGDDDSRERLLKGIREQLTSNMSKRSLSLVRGTQNYLVQAVNAGIQYKNIKKYQDDVLLSSSPSNTTIDSSGRVARRFKINNNNIEVPVEFINEERVRVYRSYISGTKYICDVGIESDLLPSQGNLIFVLINRNNRKKQRFISPSSVISVRRAVFELDFNDETLYEFLEYGTYDLFLELKIQNRIKQYRIGQNRNLSTNLVDKSKNLKISKDKEISIYYTVYDNISIQSKKIK